MRHVLIPAFIVSPCFEHRRAGERDPCLLAREPLLKCWRGLPVGRSPSEQAHHHGAPQGSSTCLPPLSWTDPGGEAADCVSSCSSSTEQSLAAVQ